MFRIKSIIKIVLGALLIAGGVIYILDVLGIADINVSYDGWWSLFIIIPCINGILTHKDKTTSFIGLAVGILLLLAARDILDYDMVWKLIVPIIIIIIGIKMIERSVRLKHQKDLDDEDSTIQSTTMFNTKDINYTQQEITVAKIAAVFGGANCNLTDAKIINGSRIDLLCMFGGADIIVPENVNVKINTFCLFGGISDKRKITKVPEEGVTLNINGFCMFGGADIKNTAEIELTD